MTIEKGFYILAFVWLVQTFFYNILATNLTHLPGDIYLDKTGFKVYIPITSAIIISVAIILVLNHMIG